MRRQLGITLIEILIVVAITATLTVAVSHAYVATISSDKRIRAGRDSLERQQLVEDRIANFIRHAELSLSTTQQASYFIGSIGNVQGVSASGVQTSPTSTSLGSTGTANGNGNADTLIMTVTGLRIPSSILNSDDDFEAQNEKKGPQGGVEEVAISTSPVGTPPNGQTGLFLRYQRPADSDPSQGGNESLLSPDVSSIQFEFWDGSQYQQTWDTRSMTTKRLPAAVRVTYRLTGEQKDHVFVTLVPNSDVTTQNPVVETGNSTG